MKYYIETYGCQMNKYDSGLVESILTKEGFSPTDNPQAADLILVNTCSVRAHAEKRALGRIAYLSGVKKKDPNKTLVVFGCMAKNFGEEIIKQIPLVDFVLGPDDFPSLVELINNKQRHIVKISTDNFTGEGTYPVPNSIKAFVAVSRGCNNFCSYCIVPYVRGRERNRPLYDIVNEIKWDVSYGVKEITLLGQNVNSWTDGVNDFADLLRTVSNIKGILRVRFLTSHPKDLSDRIITAMHDNTPICKSIHLPLQSGSNRILRLMNRKYTREEYLVLVEKLRSAMPQISITTDIIVGFPTETEEDFADTIDIIKRVRFDGIFSFYFSPRPRTVAAEMLDDVPYAVKIERLKEVIALGNAIAKENARTLIGSYQKVLVEGRAEKNPELFCGLTETGRVVVFPACEKDIGSIVTVKIEDATCWALKGVKV